MSFIGDKFMFIRLDLHFSRWKIFKARLQFALLINTSSLLLIFDGGDACQQGDDFIRLAVQRQMHAMQDRPPILGHSKSLARNIASLAAQFPNPRTIAGLKMRRSKKAETALEKKPGCFKSIPCSEIGDDPRNPKAVRKDLPSGYECLRVTIDVNAACR